jgi:hypothetical protein
MMGGKVQTHIVHWKFEFNYTVFELNQSWLKIIATTLFIVLGNNCIEYYCSTNFIFKDGLIQLINTKSTLTCKISCDIFIIIIITMRVYRMRGSLYPLNGININTKINTTISKTSATRTVNDRSHKFQKLTVNIFCHVKVVFQIQRNGYLYGNLVLVL